MFGEARSGATGYRVHGDALNSPAKTLTTTGEVSAMLLDIRVLIFLGVIMALVLMSSADGADATSPYLTDLESEVVEEMNLARSEPGRYAQFLEERRQYYRGRRFERPGQVAIITNEGVSAVDEAIDFLRRAKPVGALRPSKGMSTAAKDHVRDQGPSGGTGHRGNDGSQMSDRVKHYGRWTGKIGENISYGRSDARDVVIQLIVDDGIRTRGHRRNMFDPEFRVVGVACGEHVAYRAMCVMTFATGYLEH